MGIGNHNKPLYLDPGGFPSMDKALRNLGKVMKFTHQHDTLEGRSVFMARVFDVNTVSKLTARTGKHAVHIEALTQTGQTDDQFIEIAAYPEGDGISVWPSPMPTGPKDQRAIAQLPTFIASKSANLPIPPIGSLIEISFYDRNALPNGGRYNRLLARANPYPKIDEKSGGALVKKAGSNPTTSIHNPSNLTLGFE